MERLAMATALGLGLLLSAGAADAQWRYTDDKGVSRVTQYKIDVPEPSRDAAEWIGPVGIGKPALSAEQVRAAQISDAFRRIGTAEAGLVQFRNMPAPARPAPDRRAQQADGDHVRLGRAAGHDLPGHLEGRRRVQLGLL